MTLPERIQFLLKRAFAALHPCLYGPMGGGESGDPDSLYAALQKEVALLMPNADAPTTASAAARSDLMVLFFMPWILPHFGFLW